MIYAVTIFLSSFLLFMVQPLIARLILPWFGGSAAVWTTCMLFYQALLLAGYAYAHALERLPRGRLKPLIHTVLLVAAVATLPIAPAEGWKPTGEEEPISRILLLLAATVGLPYFLVASTSPLLQAWFARARPGENPYRLFAVSNFASLIALVGYPFVFEPFFAGRAQVMVWSSLFVGFALLCAALAWRTPQREVAAERLAVRSLGGREIAMWLALSATGSVLLLAVTNHLTQNVAAVPLLWLAPLTLYLASFILAFSGGPWYRPQFLWPLVLAWLAAMAWVLIDADLHFNLPVQLAAFLPGLAFACLFCHGELYRLRPPPRQLTAFYLIVAAGGALGGLLVAVVAPLVFNAYYELGIGLVVLAVLATLRFSDMGRLASGASLALLLVAVIAVTYDARRHHQDVRVSERGFYGVLRVKEYGAPQEPFHLRRLVHGAIMHGEQYLHESRRGLTTTYYVPSSGIGAAIRARQAEGPMRVGVIGLGTGTLAAYGRPADVYRFYEIDPRVIDLARAHFTYLSDSAATIEMVLGDARLALEREPPQRFDILAVDAFSSDAIPVHLITREALGVYLRHVTDEGIVAFHVSNRFLDLVPVVARLAAEHGAHAVLVSDDPDEDAGFGARSDWVLVSRERVALERDALLRAGAKPPPQQPRWRAWTDDYSNLFQILK